VGEGLAPPMMLREVVWYYTNSACKPLHQQSRVQSFCIPPPQSLRNYLVDRHDTSMQLKDMVASETDVAVAVPRSSDWTDDLPQNDHVCFFKAVDWSRTQLGPTSQWRPELRMYTHMLMSDSRAATLYW